MAERALPVRHREPREAVLLEAQVHRTRRGELDRRRDPSRPRPPEPATGAILRDERGELGAGLQEGLAVGTTQLAERLERPAVADGGEDVGQFAVLRPGVVDVVGDHHGQPQLVGEGGGLGHQPVVVGEEVMPEFQEEAARCRAIAPAEECRVALRDRARADPVAHAQAPRELPVATPGQGHESLGVLGDERLAEAWHPLRAGEVRVRDQPRQAAPAHLRTREQHEMRTAAAVADPAQVLLDRLPIPGQSRALGPWPVRQPVTDDAVQRARRARVTRPAWFASSTSRRDHHPARIRDRRIAQPDLQSDHRMESDRLGRTDEADRAVQAVVIRDGQPGQPEFDRPFDQVVRGRGTLEEREVGVAVEFGVRDGRHGSLRSGAGLAGLLV